MESQASRFGGDLYWAKSTTSKISPSRKRPGHLGLVSSVCLMTQDCASSKREREIGSSIRPETGSALGRFRIVDSETDGLFRTLVLSTRAMRFVPTDKRRELALK